MTRGGVQRGARLTVSGLMCGWRGFAGVGLDRAAGLAAPYRRPDVSREGVQHTTLAVKAARHWTHGASYRRVTSGREGVKETTESILVITLSGVSG